MKITRLETIHVKPRWLFLKIHTDQDIVGVGEPTLEGRCRTVETAIREMEEYLIGQDPRQIEKHWQTLHRSPFYRTGPVLCSALSGVEQALWDILGKSLNAPVWQLLGGKVRDRVRMYGWVAGEQTGDYIENFKRSIHDRQFTLYKFVPVPAMRYLESPAVIEQVVENVAQLRAAAGPHIDIGLDFHARTTPALAKVLARKLEQFDPLFLEEPVLPGDTQALRDISNSTCIPIATGERLFTRWQFQDIIQQQAVAIVQPDVSLCRRNSGSPQNRGNGGTPAISPWLRTVPSDRLPRCCLQVAACTPNFLAQEHLHLGEGYLRDPFQVDEQGYIPVSDKPGLGVELDDAAIEEKRYPGDWQNPWFTLEDGSYAEW